MSPEIAALPSYNELDQPNFRALTRICIGAGERFSHFCVFFFSVNVVHDFMKACKCLCYLTFCDSPSIPASSTLLIICTSSFHGFHVCLCTILANYTRSIFSGRTLCASSWADGAIEAKGLGQVSWVRPSTNYSTRQRQCCHLLRNSHPIKKGHTSHL